MRCTMTHTHTTSSHAFLAAWRDVTDAGGAVALTGTSFQYHFEGDYPTGRGGTRETNRKSIKVKRRAEKEVEGKTTIRSK